MISHSLGWAPTTVRSVLVKNILILLAVISIGSTIAKAHEEDEFVAATIAVGLHDGRDIVGTPDGRLFVAQGSGEVLSVVNDSVLPTPLISIPVGSVGNRGLHSIALDEDFINNGFFYAVYTPVGVDFNRLSRFTAVGNLASLNSEFVILDLPLLESAVTHYGGAVVDNGDGTLLVTVGDYENPTAGQDLGTLTGTLLRVNKNGSVPGNNPYVGDDGVDDLIYAHGLRNPWQISRKASTGQTAISDVGGSLWEEVNLSSAGANFGWADAEGPFGTGEPPLFAFPHFGLVPGTEFEGCAITGSTFYEPDVIQFPVEFVGTLFVGDLCAGWIASIDPDSGSTEMFLSGFNSLADLTIDPTTGIMYALDRNIVNRDTGIVRIEFVGTDVLLAITSQPIDLQVAIGQNATFFVSAVGQGNLRYQWQRNGLDIPGATAATYVAGSVTAAEDGALFRVVVSDDTTTIASDVAQVLVSSNQAPEPFISDPAEGLNFAGGEESY